MNKRTDEWKKYVKEAKIRLNQSRFNPVDDEVFYMNSQKLTKQDISRMNSIISEVVASDDFVSDPLGRLIENDVYNRLDNEAKTKYMLDLSSIYLALRAKFNK